MRLVPTGRTAHELVEVYQLTHCRDCKKPLKSPNVSLGTVHCPVHHSHRTLRCRGCGTVNVDDECTESYDQNPLKGHAHGQYGEATEAGA